MEIAVTPGDIAAAEADVVIVNLFEGVKTPGGGTGAINAALDGLLERELQLDTPFSGKLGQTLVLHTHGRIPARHVIVVGLGKADGLNNQAIRRASAAAVRTCQRLKARTVATLLHGAGTGGFDVTAAARLLAEGTLLGAYRFDKYKARKDNGDDTVAIARLTVVEADAARVPAIETGLRLGRVVAENTNLARDWVFDSANAVTPTFLRQQAEAMPGLACTVLDFERIQALGMGAFALVAQGSEQPPCLIHLAWKPAGPAARKIALVGKGVTFDSGGLSLKPPKSQELMKMDMAGAAAVLCTLKAVAELAALGLVPDAELHAFVPACENMPSGRSSKPGDIVRAMNGKTVEVNNTDAEGRLILADALTYAQREVSPDVVIDLATLTGACITALGKAASGILGTDQALIDAIRASGDKAGEKYWQLPLYDEYKDALKSDVADLINAGSGGEAGTSAGAMFLKEFIDPDRAWAHCDIAGPAWAGKDQPEVPKGATGVGVRTLLYYLYGW